MKLDDTWIIFILDSPKINLIKNSHGHFVAEDSPETLH